MSAPVERGVYVLALALFYPIWEFDSRAHWALKAKAFTLHQGIDFAGLDGAKRVLRGLQPSEELGVRAGRPSPGGRTAGTGSPHGHLLAEVLLQRAG